MTIEKIEDSYVIEDKDKLLVKHHDGSIKFYDKPFITYDGEVREVILQKRGNIWFGCDRFNEGTSHIKEIFRVNE